MSKPLLRYWVLLVLVLGFDRLWAQELLRAQELQGEAAFFTPPGHTVAGVPKELAAGHPGSGIVRIQVRDKLTREITPCRINVVGADGNYYQPESRFLSQFDMTGVWPQNGAWGNRPGKAPFRYIGHYFYFNSETDVRVPSGSVRIEVWKGFEYRPVVVSAAVPEGKVEPVTIWLERSVPMADWGYYGGDPHLHFPRTSDRDDYAIFDLMEAEDVWFGTPLGYNEPAGPYSGTLEKMASPQLRQLGFLSIRSRGNQVMMSGQEYRSVHFGHLNLYGLPKLVFQGQSFNLDDGPAYGTVGSEAIAQGGFAIHAHGGYAKEIYADAALGAVSAVELLQFGVYRELGLSGWYDMLSSGYRFPCVGASDFPACRFMSDCRTYVRREDSESKHGIKSTFEQWFRGLSAGHSFVTTGPLLLMDIDGRTPGDIIPQSGIGKRYQARVRVRSEVAPVTHIDLIVSGETVKSMRFSASEGQGKWLELEHVIEPQQSCWIAARAWSTNSAGQPDAEAHTNPIYVDVDHKRAFDISALDRWTEKIDGQIALHSKRKFKDKAGVLAYFQSARDILISIRRQRGLSSEQIPWKLGADAASTVSRTANTERKQQLSTELISENDLKEFLQPVPPKSPQQALREFEIAEGYQIELAAAEPIVVDPVAAAYDEQGQLYVCEMRDYPFKPAEGGQPLGTVRLLRDLDFDGVFDEGHVFADKLLWAAGVQPWKGGIFVAAAPDIWYLKDSDGDFRADIRRRVFTGFGTENQQAMVNNLQFGLDQWIYGTTAGNGGNISVVDQPNAPPIVLNGRDFRFCPETERLEAITGTVQFGNTFDDWGNRFTCSESQPVLHIVQPDHYLARNPFLSAPRGVLNVAPGPVPIYRISPIERWRQIRSSRRIAKNERSAESPGASHHVIDAAAGATVYRGSAFPTTESTQIFIGDGQNNLVHRRHVIPEGVTFRTERIDTSNEFLRSADIWFRPVNFVNAPDGTLLCLDMYREVLESIHIPLDVARHLNFANGREHGRIYRLSPSGFVRPSFSSLRSASNLELVRHLEDRNGWYRDTAQRLLIERRAVEVATQLQQVARDSQFPESRLHALWTLHNLKVLDEATLLNTLKSKDSRLREHAIRLSESKLRDHPPIAAAVISLSQDVDVRIRYQVAFSLGYLTTPAAATALADLARRDGTNSWLRTAILSSASEVAPELLGRLLESREQVSHEMLRTVAELVGARKHPAEIEMIVTKLQAVHASKKVDSVETLLCDLGRGMQQSGQNLGSQLANPWIQSQQELAIREATDAAVSMKQRLSAIELLGYLPSPASRKSMLDLLAAAQPDDLQVAIIRACTDDQAAEISECLLVGWNAMTPSVRKAALDWMLARKSRTIDMLEAATRGEIALSDIDFTRREQLVQHPDALVRSLAKQVFGAIQTQSRQEVIRNYTAALELTGRLDNGKLVFEKNCAACHQVSGIGVSVGPSISISATQQPRVLLSHILDPNQYVQPNFIQYRALDKQGRISTGMIVAQTANSLTLRKDRDQSITILRSEIEELQSTGRSLMPEEFEKSISIQEMADLMAFLQASVTKGTLDPTEVRDFGTLPGLIEPD